MNAWWETRRNNMFLHLWNLWYVLFFTRSFSLKVLHCSMFIYVKLNELENNFCHILTLPKKYFKWFIRIWQTSNKWIRWYWQCLKIIQKCMIWIFTPNRSKYFLSLFFQVIWTLAQKRCKITNLTRFLSTFNLKISFTLSLKI